MNNVYKRIALLGATGNPNLGDEAVLETNIQKIRNMYGDSCLIYVFSKDPSYTSLCNGDNCNIKVVDYLHQYTIACGYDVSKMKGLEIDFLNSNTNNYRYRLLHNIFKEIDVLHIVGGGYMNSLWPDMFYEVCLAVKLAKLYKKRYCFTGISVYPFDNQYIDDLISCFDGADFVDFRDNSYKYVAVCDNLNYVQTIDDAVELKDKNKELKFKTYATLAFHEWNNNNCVDDLIVNKIVPFMKRCLVNNVVDGFYILGFSNGDVDLWDEKLDDLNDYVCIENLYLNGEICEAKFIVSNAKFNIGTRFHQAVFSLSDSVPVLSIAYDEYYLNKLNSIHDCFGFNQVFNVNDVDESILYDFISHADDIKKFLIENKENIDNTSNRKNSLLSKFYGSKIVKQNKDKPYISVIIPVYNQEKYIEECVKSVINQSLKDIEIICVNDGSTDGSYWLLRGLGELDKRIKIIDQDNHGVSYARNVALESANGEFVYFLDSDDYIPDNNVLSDLYYAAKKNNVLVCGGSFSEHLNTGINDTFTGIAKKNTFDCDGIVEYKDYQFDFGWTRFIYNREFLIENDLKLPYLTYFEDPVFFVRTMHKAKRFYALRRHTYRYRWGYKEFSMTKKRVLDFLDGIYMNIKLAKENGYNDLLSIELYRLEYDYGKDVLRYLTDCKNIDVKEKVDNINNLMGYSGGEVVEYRMVRYMLERENG